jgi:hypothetical protein
MMYIEEIARIVGVEKPNAVWEYQRTSRNALGELMGGR